jgi:LmbE family N-acetylglucosaminyl deacetylase
MAHPILVIAPHPDDESIGCGGAIALHQEGGARVRVVFLTSGERGIEGNDPEAARALREDEALAALHVLGIQEQDFLRLPDLGLAESVAVGAPLLAEILRSDQPDVIYLPHPDEAHPDHAAALSLLQASRQQAPGARHVPELRAYEVWTPMTRYDWAEDITGCMARKLRAVRCYRSQLRTFRYDRAVRGLNQYRGCLAARCRYAEVFRWLDPTEGTP